MRAELDLAMREVEAKLPELRRLLAESEVQLSLSEDAEAWAWTLLQTLRLSDEIAGRLRLILLGRLANGEHGGVAPSKQDDKNATADPSEFERNLDIEADLERVLFGDDTEDQPSD